MYPHIDPTMLCAVLSSTLRISPNSTSFVCFNDLIVFILYFLNSY